MFTWLKSASAKYEVLNANMKGSAAALSLNDDSDGAHLTSFGIEFQTEEVAKENQQ